MKTIRTNTFETNSSSTHSVTIKTKGTSKDKVVDPLVKDNVLYPSRLGYNSYVMKRYVTVKSVEEYFALPRQEREYMGWYLKPFALPWEGFGQQQEQGWRAWSKRIRQEYPVQGFVREWLFDKDNPVYSFFVVRKMKLEFTWSAIKLFCNPALKRWRASAPRHKWRDISTLVVDSNFALVLDFWYDEVLDGWINWEANEQHKEFHTWIKKAVYYIEQERPALEKQIEVSYANLKGTTYEERYGTIDKIQKDIDSRDTILLKDIIDNRKFFWT